MVLLSFLNLSETARLGKGGKSNATYGDLGSNTHLACSKRIINGSCEFEIHTRFEGVLSQSQAPRAFLFDDAEPGKRRWDALAREWSDLLLRVILRDCRGSCSGRVNKNAIAGNVTQSLFNDHQRWFVSDGRVLPTRDFVNPNIDLAVTTAVDVSDQVPSSFITDEFTRLRGGDAQCRFCESPLPADLPADLRATRPLSERHLLA